jgi:hypothetical protein
MGTRERNLIIREVIAKKVVHKNNGQQEIYFYDKIRTHKLSFQFLDSLNFILTQCDLNSLTFFASVQQFLLFSLIFTSRSLARSLLAET